VDDDPAYHGLVLPALSSIDPDSGQRGYQAVAMADRMKHGGSPEHTRIQPLRVVERASTAGYAWSARRLAEAQYLVRATDLDILTVALRSGFFSHSSFTPYFKRKTGLTPKEFRKSSSMSSDGDGQS
jgi:methylphosphotriester-DNA--protein-cysteine methyltransferase